MEMQLEGPKKKRFSKLGGALMHECMFRQVNLSPLENIGPRGDRQGPL